MTMLLGPQKAAVVLAQLDNFRAQKILKAMSETEVVDLMSAMATLPALHPDIVQAIVSEFSMQTAARVDVGQGGIDVARKLLRDRLGAARTEEILDQFVSSGQIHPLSNLQRIDPQQITSFISEEHPQTIGVVLAHLTPDHSAAILAILPEDLRAEVSKRIATMGRISPDVIQVIADILERKLAALLRFGTAASSEVGGVQSIVAILNQTDRSSEKQILTALEESDPELAEQIRNEMFVFDDVVSLDDRTLQRVLRNVVPKELAVALKGVPDEIREKFLRNMSERAAQDLVEEIEVLGPTRVSQVEAAQSSVVRVVRELDASGEIVLTREDDEFV
jgi:flagellar motor switch protein FliG